MKTTLVLPDHLVRQVKQRALQQGRTLKELVADYIRQGLRGGTSGSAPPASNGVTVDGAGLPAAFEAHPAHRSAQSVLL